MPKIHTYILPLKLHISRLFFVFSLFFSAFLGSSTELFAQLNATQARHESLNQNSVAISLDASLGAAYTCVGGCLANWTVTVAGVPVVITSVIGASGSNRAVIAFGSSIGIGEAVIVSHTNDGTIGNIAGLVSENNYFRECSDFTINTIQVNGTLPCAPVAPQTAMIFEVSRRARNSTLWAGATSRVNWGPAGAISNIALTETDGSGNPAVNSYFVSIDARTDAYVYPSNEVVCGYSSVWRIRLNNGPAINCPISDPAQGIVYASHNTDAAGEGDGALASQPTVANSDLVCEGDFVNMSFDDVSDLNCIDLAAAPSPIPINERDRNIRVIYGLPHDGTANTIRNVFVAGTQITDASGALLVPGGFIPTAPNALGTPDGFGVVNFPSVVTGPSGTLENITTSTVTLDGDVGRTFNITIQYWNTCNQYDLAGNAINNNAREITDQVVVIVAPPIPAADDDAICEGDATGAVDFTITGAAGSSAINWFDDDPTTVGVDITGLNGDGANSTTFPVDDLPAFDTNTPGDYSVWATYVIGATNSCESEAIETTVTVREDLTIGTVNYDTGIDPVCAGTNGLSFSLPAAAATEAFGGPTQYVWSVSGGLSISGGNNGTSATVDVGAATADGTQTVSVFRRYTDVTPACNSAIVTYDIEVDAVSNGGTLSGGTTPICEGESTGNITLTTTTPNVVRWERRLIPGVFIDLGAAFVGLTTISQTLSAEGTYEYRAVVKNGVCSEANSAIRTIVVNDKPSLATLSGTTDICRTDNATLNIAITGGTAPYNVTIDNGVGVVVWNNATDDPTVSPLTTTTYTITAVTDTNGCTPTSITGSAIISVTNPTDAVLGGDASICNTDNTDLTVTITGGTGPYSITITDNQASSANIGTIAGYVSGANINTGALTASTVYTLTSVIDADLCPVLGISDDEATVTVGVAISAATLDVVDVCAGEDFIFSVDITDGAPPYTVNYTVDGTPGVENPYLSGADINLGALAVGVHPVVITNVQDACGTNFGPLVFQNIEVFALPTANNQTPTVCSDAALGTTATVDLTSLEAAIDGGAANTITWYTGNAPLSGMIVTPASYVVTNGVSIFAEVDNGAVPVNCTNVATVTYTVNGRPSPPTNPISGIACSSDATGATLSVDDPGAGFTVNWYTAYTSPAINTPVIVADGVVSGSNGEVFTPTSNATATFFAAIETDVSTCLSVSAVSATNTQDLLPTGADADADDDPEFLETCDDELILAATAADNGGTGSWSFPGLLYSEDFENLADGTTVNTDQYGWSIDISGLPAFAGSDHFEVQNNYFAADDIDGVGIWESDPIDISAITNFDISIDASEPAGNNNDNNDYIELYYQIDASPEVQVGTRLRNDFNAATISEINAATGGGALLTIRVKMDSRGDNDEVRFDNVRLVENGADPITFSNASDENATVSGLTVGTTALTWTVSSGLGACNASFESINVIRHPLPVANNLTPALCEDLPQGSNVVVGVDLTTTAFNDGITGAGLVAGGTRTIQYFDDAARLPGDEILPAAAASIDISNGEVIYIRVTDIGTSAFASNFCTQDATITFTVDTRPTTVDIDDATTTFCEDVFASAAHAGVNLETTYNTVAAGGSLASRSVTWYLGYNAGTEVFSSPIVVGAAAGETQNFEAQNGLTIFAEVRNTVTSCVDVALIDFNVNPLPAANPIQVNAVAAPNPSIFCRSTGLILFQVDDAINVGSTYQWSASDPAKIDILGGTTNEFVIVVLNTAIALADGEFIELIETTVDGCPGPATQLQVVVTDAPSAPTINGDIDACTSQTGIVYTVTPANPTSTYAWTLPTGASISGATDGSSITVNFGTSSGNIGVTETNNLGCTSPAAVPLAITLHDRPVLDPGLNATVCSDDVSGITFASTGVPLATDYQITSVFVTPGLLEDVGNAAKNGTNHTNVAAGFIAGDKFRNLTTTDLAVVYTVVPTTEDPVTLFCDGDPVNVTLTIQPEPIGIIQATTVCSGDITNVTFTTNGSAIAADRFDVSETSRGANIVGAATTGLLLPNNAIENNVYTNISGAAEDIIFQITPHSSIVNGNCTGDPFNVTITVDPAPVMTSANNETICSGDSPTLAFTSNVFASTFAWTVTSVTNVSGTTVGDVGTTLTTETLTNLNGVAGTVVYNVIPTGPTAFTCDGAAQVVTITVDPAPVMTSANNETICSGDSPTLVFTSNVPTSTFAWTVTSVANVSGTTVGDVGTTLTTETLTNLNGVVGTVEYNVIPTGPTALTCAGAIQVVTITVDPAPVMTSAATETICSGDSPTLSFTSNVPAATFAWTVMSVTNVSGTTVGDVGTTLTTETLTNLNGVVGTVVYNVIPTGPTVLTCVGATQVVTITVDPAPVITSANNETICSGNSPALAITSNVPAATFAWTVTSVTNVSGTTVGDVGTTLTSETLTNLNGVIGTVVYNVIPTGPTALTCDGAAQVVTITVDPAPVMTSATTETICSGDSPTLTFTSNVPTATFAWTVMSVTNVSGTTVGDVGTTLTTETLTNLNGVAGTVIYNVIPTGPTALSCDGATQVVTITVDPAPVMTSAAVETICSGDSPTLTFTSNVPAATFAWTVTSVTNVSGTTVGDVGTTLTSETLTNLNGVVGTVVYNVIPTGPSALTCDGAIQVVTISVDPAPVMTSAATETICSGDSPTLAFTSNVVGTTFAWTVASVTNVTGTTVGDIGITLTSETLFNISGADGTVVYSVVPTGPTALTCIGAVQLVTVTVNPAPVMTSTITETICSGDSPTLTFTSNVAGATFAWTVASVTNVTGTTVGDVGTTLTTEVLSNTSGADGTVVYNVIPTGPTALTCDGATQVVTVTVNPAPVMTSINNETICSGDSPTLTFTSNVPSATFAWVVGSVTNVSGTTVGDVGTTLTTETLTNLNGVAGTVVYNVTPTGPTALTCAGAVQVVTITVDPAPVITSANNETICSGDSPTLVFTSNVPATTFAWTVASVTNVTGTTIGDVGTTLTTETLTNLNGVVGTVVYSVVPTGPAALTCVGAAQIVTITVDPAPVMTSATTETICSGDSPTLTFTSNVPASTFAWTVASITNVTGTTVGDVGTTLTTETLINLNGVAGTVVYNVIPTGPTALTCNGATQVVTITVDPAPVMTSAAAETICSGTSPTLNFTSNVPASTFAWTVTSATNVSGTTVGDVGTTLTTETLTNLNGIAGTVVYDVIPTGPTALTCAGAVQVVTITVDPAPLMTSVAAETICSGSSPTLAFTSNVPASTFAWTVSSVTNVTGTIVGDVGTTLTTETLTNLNGVAGTVVYNVIPTGPAALTCVGVTQVVTITVDPAPVMTSANNQTICSGDSPTLAFTSNVLSATFAWTVATITNVTGTTVGDVGTTLTTETLTNLNGVAGTVVYNVIPTGPTALTCDGAVQVVTITVDPAPVMTSAAVETICSGDSPTLIFTSNVPGATFSRTVTSISNVSGTTVGNVGTTLTTEVLTNTSGVIGTVTYDVVATGPTALTCDGAVQVVTVTVDPEPVMTSVNSETICSGGSPTLAFTSNVPASTFAWTVVSVTNVTGTTVGDVGTTLTTETLANLNGVPGSVVYNVIPTGPTAFTCDGVTQVVTITVDPAPVMTSVNNQTICSGDSPTLAFTSNVPSATFAWTVASVTNVAGTTVGDVGTTLTSETLTNVNGVVGTVVYNVIPTGPTALTCDGATQVVTISVDPEPVISSVNTETICSGASPTLIFSSNVPGATFSRTVTSISNVSGTTVGNVGTTLTTEVLTNISGVVGTVTYDVVATGPTALTCSGAIQIVTITVDPEPVMTSASTETICSGDSPTLAFTSNVPSATFAWTVASVTNVSGTTVGDVGTTLTTETLTNVNGVTGTVVYNVIPTGPTALTCDGATQVVTVTVDPAPVMTSVNNQTICSGDSPTLAFTSNVPSATFAWTVASVTNVSGTTIGDVGTTLTTETLTNLNGVIGTVVYNVIPTGPTALTCNGATQVVTITVDPAPVMTSAIIETICSGNSPTLAFTSNVVGATFGWTVASVTNVVGTVVGNVGTTLTSEVLTNTSGVAGTVVYNVIPTGPTALTCDGATQVVTITVDPAPVMTSVNNETICSGASPTLVFTSNVPSATFAWTVASVANVSGTTVGDIGTTLTSETLTNLNGVAGTVVYNVIPTGPTVLICDGATQVVTITVDPAPVMTSVATETICSGTSPTLAFTSNVAGATFAWTVTSVTNVTGTIVGDVGTTLTTETLTNLNGVGGTVIYNVTPTGPTALTCDGAVQIVAITVDPAPVISSANNQTICSSASPTLAFISNVPAATFAWTVTSVTNVSGTTIGDVGTTLTSETLFNTSGADGTVTYDVTATGPTALTCDGAVQVVTITVNPAPVMTSANSETICSGNTPSINFSSNVVGSTFSWVVTSVHPDISGTFLGKVGTDFTVESLTNFGVGAVTATYDVTATGPVGLGCVGITQTVTITVDPGPRGFDDFEQACSNVALNYDIQADNINDIVSGGNGVAGQFTYIVSSPSGLVLEGPRVTASTLPINFNYINTTSTPAVVTYTITPVGFGACVAGVPFNVQFTINPEPVIVPISETICSGEIPAITVSSSNFSLGTVDYAYVVSNISGTVSGVVLGDNGITTTIPHTITNTSSAQAIVTYTFTPTENINNTCVGEDFDVLITVDPEPVGSDTVLPTICSGDAINLAADTFIANLSGNIFSWTATYGALSGGAGSGFAAISETLTNTTALPINVVYDIVPTSSGGACPGASFSVTIPIDPEPELEVPVISPAPVCSDIIIGYQLTTLATSVAADSYNIISVTPDVGLAPVVITSGIGLTDMAIFNDVYTNNSNGLLSVTYTIVPVTGGCEGQAETITFGVNPAPNFIANLDNVVCSDAPTSVSLTIDTPSSIAATNYRFESMSAPGLIENGANMVETTDVFPFTVSVAQVNILTADMFTNNTNDPIDVVYQVTPLNGACEGPTKTITVTIEPQVTFDNPGPNAICSGQASGVVLNSSTNPTNGGVVFDYVMTAPLLSPASSTGTSLGQGHTINDVLINNTNTVQTATYEIFRYATELAANGLGCDNAGTSEFVVVSVDPVPSMDLITTQTICSGDPLSLQLISSTVLPAPFAVDFELIAFDYAGVNVTSSSGLTVGDTYSANGFLTDNLINNTTTTQIVTYTLRPRNNRSLTSCSGTDVTITVNVNPTPQGFTIDPIDPQCALGVYIATFNFPVGQAPFRFDYEVRDKATNALIVSETNKVAGATGVGVVNGIDKNITDDITVILTRVEYGISSPICSASGVLATRDITIVDPDPTFSPVAGLEAVCSTPGLVQFNFVVDTDVTYTWNWGDGSAEEIVDGSVASSPISHPYSNPSFTDFTYTAFLLVESKIVPNCVKFSDQSVVIYPDILPIIFAFQDEVCSGDEVKMFNSSIGADIHNWYYTVNGVKVADSQQDQTVKEAAFTLVNSSDPTDPSFSYTNPQEFVIHYQGFKDNGSGDVCSTDLADADTQYRVMVYKEIDINFDTDDGSRNYSLTTGSVNIGFVNNSIPVSNPDFTYDWNYGNGKTSNAYDPEIQLYTVAREYDITHTITNTIAINDGVQCSNFETITISIDETPIVPDFEIDIVESCVPTDGSYIYTITNKTTGAANQFTWKVFDGTNIAYEAVQSTSQDGTIDPGILEFSFEIFASGIYTVQLTAENAQSGQSATKTEEGLINVYASPQARFEIRPKVVVFVPDDELTTFNFTDENSRNIDVDDQGRARETNWLWNFGDGEGTSTDVETIYTYNRVSEDEPGGVFKISLTASYVYNNGSISCSNTYTDSIRAELGGNIRTPNAFSPNKSGPSGGLVSGDNEDNDVFLPQLDGVVEFKMLIFDRWGVLVFESNDRNIGWDGYHKNGKIMPQGVYVFKLELRLVNGEREVRIGDITLLK